VLRDRPVVVTRNTQTLESAWKSIKHWNSTYITEHCNMLLPTHFFKADDNITLWEDSGRRIAQRINEASASSDIMRDFFEKYEEQRWMIMSMDMKCNCPALLRDFPWPKYLQYVDQEMLSRGRWPSIYIYPKGASLRVHIDSTSKWPYWTDVHRGRKLMRIIPFSEWSSSEELFRMFSGKGREASGQLGFDIWSIQNNSSVSSNRTVTVYEAIVEAGDSFYSPHTTAHSVIHLEPTVNTVIKFFDELHKDRPLKELCDKYVRAGRLPRKTGGDPEHMCRLLQLPTFNWTSGEEHAEDAVMTRHFWDRFASPYVCNLVRRECANSVLCKAALPLDMQNTCPRGSGSCDAWVVLAATASTHAVPP